MWPVGRQFDIPLPPSIHYSENISSFYFYFFRADGVKVFKYKAWRRKGVVIPEILEEYQSVGASLNVMPYCSQFIPMEVINSPQHKSICYHPSILPRHRGASAIR